MTISTTAPTPQEAAADSLKDRPHPDVDIDQVLSNTRVVPGTVTNPHEQFRFNMREQGFTKKSGRAALEEMKAEFFALMDILAADQDRAVLFILQGIDAAGKDGIIKHVLEGVNPSEVDVTGFKAPSKLEMSHDFLWRNELEVPALGKMAIFNRSHYENVLVTRVHPELLWPKTSMPVRKDIWQQRYDEINNWERRLYNNGTIIIKMLLLVSKEEQGRRFLERINNPAKNWKVSPTDMKERGFWDEYTEAFTDMLNHTSTEHAPWHVLSMDEKWSGQLEAITILLNELRALNLHYPEVSAEDRERLVEMKRELEAGQ